MEFSKPGQPSALLKPFLIYLLIFWDLESNMFRSSAVKMTKG